MLYNNGFNTENTTTDRGGRICRQDGCSTVQFFQLFIFCRQWAYMTIFHKHVCSVHLFLPCLILKILSVSWQWQWKARLCTHYEKYFLFACCLWGMNSWKGASILSRFTSSPFCGCDFSAGREGDLSFFFLILSSTSHAVFAYTSILNCWKLLSSSSVVSVSKHRISATSLCTKIPVLSAAHCNMRTRPGATTSILHNHQSASVCF